MSNKVIKYGVVGLGRGADVAAEGIGMEGAKLGDDPSITLDYSLSDVSLNADDFTYLKITYMVPADQSRADCAYALYPCVGSVTSPTADAHVFSPNGIIADGEYHTLIIDMSGYTFWSGRINKIRFDYFNEYFEIGEVFYIKSIVLE